MANGTPIDRVEKLNQAVRSIVTVTLCAGFVVGFVWLGKISAEIYTTVFAGVVGYWFASRDAKSRSSDQQTITPTPDTTAVVQPVKPNG